MVFEIECRPHSTEIQDNSLLAKLIPTDLSQVRRASIDGNNVTLSTPLSHLHNLTRPLEKTSIELTGVERNGTGFNAHYNLDGSHKYIFSLSNPHSFFKRALSDDQRPNSGTNLRNLELPIPESFSVTLVYRTPFGIWHGLPEEVLDKTKKFQISAGDVSVFWPGQMDEYRSQGRGDLPTDKQRISVNSGFSTIEGTQKTRRGIVEEIAKLHSILTYEKVTRGTDNHSPSYDKFELKGDVQPTHLRDIEDCVRRVVGEGEVMIGIDGSLTPQELGGILPDFDRYTRSSGYEFNRTTPRVVSDGFEIIGDALHIGGDLETATRYAALLRDYDKETQVRLETVRAR